LNPANGHESETCLLESNDNRRCQRERSALGDNGSEQNLRIQQVQLLIIAFTIRGERIRTSGHFTPNLREREICSGLLRSGAPSSTKPGRTQPPRKIGQIDKYWQATGGADIFSVKRHAHGTF
jgi:hypothetical protein